MNLLKNHEQFHFRQIFGQITGRSRLRRILLRKPAVRDAEKIRDEVPRFHKAGRAHAAVEGKRVDLQVRRAVCVEHDLDRRGRVVKAESAPFGVHREQTDEQKQRERR